MESLNYQRYFFRISKKDEPTLRGKSEFSILDMKKDGVRFRNSKMSKASDKYLNLQKEYEATQTTLVEKIMEIVCMFPPSFSPLCYFIICVY